MSANEYAHYQQHGDVPDPNSRGGRTFYEWIEVGGEQLISTITQLVKDGNVRRIILRDSTGRELFSVPMTAGVAVSGLAVLAAPTLAAIGAITALVTKVTLEVERIDVDPNGAGPQQQMPTQGSCAEQDHRDEAGPDQPLTGEVILP